MEPEPTAARDADAGSDIEAIIGVYHAKGTVLGELSYWVKANIGGGGHCALCDITHGTFREKPAWRACRDALDVRVETVHLDERSPDLEAFTTGHTPCVVASTRNGYVMLVDPGGLTACAGSPDCLFDAITAHAVERGLHIS